MTERIQRRRTKGWRMPAGVVNVTRPGPWGNPFRWRVAIEAGYAEDEVAAKRLCVVAFEDWLLKGDLSEWWHENAATRWIWMRRNLYTLYGKSLACWCPIGKPCHAAVLMKFAERAEWWPE